MTPPRTRLSAVLAVIAAILLWGPDAGAGPQAGSHAAEIDKLVAAYPDFLASRDGNAIRWTDGTEMPIDDGKGEKDFDTLLNDPDIEDMFYTPYPPGRAGTPPGVDIDPGRVRYEPFFEKMYGDCKKGEVDRKMKKIVWLPRHGAKTLRITTVNGVADKLQAVSDDLDKLPDSFVKYLTPSGGTYNCRVIAGTSRKSVHSFGAAIDINVAWSDYWRNNRPVDGKYPYKNRIPWEIVEVFEKHGFIWGGKWYHYDTMHFEYRPELLP